MTNSFRLSQLIAKDDSVIPSLYAGTTTSCARMEAVFHDAPYDGAGQRTLSKAGHFEGMVRSSLRGKQELRLIDLGSIAFGRLGSPKPG
jgi:hypothetical protein